MCNVRRIWAHKFPFLDLVHVTLLTLAQAWLSPHWIYTGWLDLAKWLTKKNETFPSRHRAAGYFRPSERSVSPGHYAPHDYLPLGAITGVRVTIGMVWMGIGVVIGG